MIINININNSRSTGLKGQVSADVVAGLMLRRDEVRPETAMRRAIDIAPRLMPPNALDSCLTNQGKARRPHSASFSRLGSRLDATSRQPTARGIEPARPACDAQIGEKSLSSGFRRKRLVAVQTQTEEAYVSSATRAARCETERLRDRVSRRASRFSATYRTWTPYGGSTTLSDLEILERCIITEQQERERARARAEARLATRQKVELHKVCLKALTRMQREILERERELGRKKMCQIRSVHLGSSFAGIIRF